MLPQFVLPYCKLTQALRTSLPHRKQQQNHLLLCSKNKRKVSCFSHRSFLILQKNLTSLVVLRLFISRLSHYWFCFSLLRTNLSVRVPSSLVVHRLFISMLSRYWFCFSLLRTNLCVRVPSSLVVHRLFISMLSRLWVCLWLCGLTYIVRSSFVSMSSRCWVCRAASFNFNIKGWNCRRVSSMIAAACSFVLSGCVCMCVWWVQWSGYLYWLNG